MALVTNLTATIQAIQEHINVGGFFGCGGHGDRGGCGLEPRGIEVVLSVKLRELARLGS